MASTIYKFKFRAVNDFGPSGFSDEIDVGVSSFPAKPNPLRKVLADSGLTYVSLEWDESLNTELPVIGYLINMDDGIGGAFTQVYNGINYPNVRTYTVTGLMTQFTYRFTLQAINFNGPSEESDVAEFIICN